MNRESIISTYGVLDRIAARDEIDEIAAELRVNGYAVLPSGLSPETIDQLKMCLDRVYEEQVREIGGQDQLRKINDADIARCVLAYEPEFLKLAACAPLMELARRILGQEFVLMMQNGIINHPERENYQAKWHRDLNYQHWTSTQPLAINALFCLDKFTNENGATHVLPGTHHVREFPTDRFVRTFEKQIEAPAGSFLILDAMLYHRAGINTSRSVRRAVNHVIGLPFMAQQIDIPEIMKRRGMVRPQDPAMQKYLGFRWAPAADVTEWRGKRLG